MSIDTVTSGRPPSMTIRKLWPMETARFRDHLLRLDKESRRLRFAHTVSDSFIVEYASRMNEMGSIVFAGFIGEEMRGAAELRKLGDSWNTEAEAAFSVERAYQDQGIGTALMGRVIRAARNRGIQLLFMSCLAENAKMQAIAKRHDAELRYELGEVVGEIVPTTSNYFSLLDEAIEDRIGYMMAVLNLQRRLIKAA